MAEVDLITTDCWCGLPFSMPERLYQACKRNGTTFYCPLGHSIVFRETDTDKMRRERDRLAQQIAQKDDAIKTLENRTAAYKGQITKLKTRVKGGVCPCCNRTFQHLRRHMQNKHPDFDPAGELKIVEGGKP